MYKLEQKYTFVSAVVFDILIHTVNCKPPLAKKYKYIDAFRQNIF